MLNTTHTSGHLTSAVNTAVYAVAFKLVGVLAMAMFFIVFGQFKSGVMV